ncbi:hypothetical protein SAMN04515666_1014 [Bosea lupini]|uniref:Uncharacterized protein n=1 Tax=Bosea lupini TaxID=1036779 RepID=A0A1H7FDU0_9HYPH|nr:hypothetical protein [Bosea lupini]SEK23457.1 hypothetical protein SAMN04515666_1014 [Bosea lupini]
MRRDLASNIADVPAIAPAVQSAAADGAAIDTKGFSSLAFLVNTGAIVGSGDFGVKLQESDSSGSGFTDVAADQVDTTAPATLTATSSYKLGYRGNKRFVRLALAKTGGTSIALGAIAVLGHPDHAPVA